MFSFNNVIHIIIIFQGSLLTLYILSKKGNSKSNLLLATIIGILSFQILGLFLANRNIQSHIFQGINCVYGFLYGPLLYLYNKSITRSDLKFKTSHLIHFLPSSIIFLGVLSGIGICQHKVYIGYSLHVLTYVIFCFLEIKNYKKVIKDNYSKLEWLNLAWLQWTFVVFSCIVIVDVTQFASFLMSFDNSKLETLVYLLILTAINILYFKGFMSSENGIGGMSQEDMEFSESIAVRKRINTELPENQALITRLNEHLVSKRTYKNSDLTIALLAQELNISKRTLSELINDCYDQNFVDFINTHRIELAKERLMNPSDPNETILEVLYDVGFNSKSSFNTAFKKKTGLTPSEFKSQYF